MASPVSEAFDIVLVGGGVASASCASQLRQEGFAGSILLVGRELDLPYERPPISKELLAGTDDAARLFLPSQWYEEQRVDVRTRTSVTKLDLGANTLELSTKTSVRFKQLLLATGANVRRLSIPGAELDGIHYLRATRNATMLREDLRDRERVVIIGGSYIGTEVAATLTQLGKRCTIVMQEKHPLSLGFGDTVGKFFTEFLQAHGVELIAGEEVESFGGDSERVNQVRCKSGRQVKADAVVVGVGALPDVTLARSAGLTLGERGGICCNAQLETEVTGVFAAGDVCEYFSECYGQHLRIEHFDAAVQQGKTVAKNMLGQNDVHNELPYFFSDLADWVSLEYVGFAASGWDSEVLRGSSGKQPFTNWYIKDGCVVAVLLVGGMRDVDSARKLIIESSFMSAPR